jgi:hypothetical protein
MVEPFDGIESLRIRGKGGCFNMVSIRRIVCIDDENGQVEVSTSSVDGVRITMVHTDDKKRTRLSCKVGFVRARALLSEALRMVELAEEESAPAK